MKNPALTHLGSAIYLTILYYGSVQFLSSWIYGYLPTGLLVALCIIGFVYYIRIPSPSTEQVEAILGRDMQYVSTDETKDICRIVAHRGAGINVPENTLEAFKYCSEQRCDFIEFDVCLTLDGVPVVFHDKSTGRLAEKDLEIAKTNWKELKKLNLSATHPQKNRFPLTRIATLDEAVTQMLAANQKMFIDVKERDPRLVQVILDLFQKYPQLHRKALVTSFFASMIYRIRRKNPKIVAAVAWCPNVIYFASKVSSQGGPMLEKLLLHMFDIIHEWLLPRFTYFLTGFSVILLHRYSTNVHSIHQWRKKGIRVICWTLNKKAEKRYCSEILNIPYLTDTLEDADPVNSQYEKDIPENYFAD